MTALLAKIPGRFSETTIDDEIVVMSLDNGDFFSLSGTGAAGWRLIDGTRDRAALIAELAAAYGVANSEISGDIDTFLDQLQAAGFIGKD